VVASGIKTLDHYLERNRVSAVPSEERNFHISYYLVSWCDCGRASAPPSLGQNPLYSMAADNRSTIIDDPFIRSYISELLRSLLYALILLDRSYQTLIPRQGTSYLWLFSNLTSK